jgi:Zn-dependent protease with chaperone function
MFCKDIKFKFLLAAVFLLSCLGAAHAQSNDAIEAGAGTTEPALEGYLLITAEAISFYYLPDANLKKLEARLRYRDTPMTVEYHELLSSPGLTTEQRISARLTIILMRVKQILGMNPQMQIRVYKTRQDMDDAYEQMFGSSTRFKSFYVHHFKSVFTNEQDFLDSVMAHELGHAVIDHYFTVPPPPQMAELMAQYVDAHLDQY